MATRYETEVIAGPRTILDGLEPEWRALCDEGPCSWITYRPEWVTAHLSSVHPESPVHVITVRHHGALRGMLLLVEQRLGIGPLALRRMRLAMDYFGWEHDLLHGRDDRDLVIDAVHRQLRTWRGWDFIDAAVVPEGGAFPMLVDRLARDGGGVLPAMHYEGWIIPCPAPGGSLDGTIAQSAMTRKRQLRRHLKKLGARGEPVWRCLTPGTPMPERRQAFDDFLRLEAGGWKGRTGDPVRNSPDLLAFCEELLRRDLFYFHRLELDGQLLAANVGIKHGDRFFSMRFAYDEAHGDVSPGHLMTLYTLTDMANRGCRDMDCAGTHAGTPTYKTDWTDQSYAIAAYTVFRPGLRGRAASAAWKAALAWKQRAQRRSA